MTTTTNNGESPMATPIEYIGPEMVVPMEYLDSPKAAPMDYVDSPSSSSLTAVATATVAAVKEKEKDTPPSPTSLTTETIIGDDKPPPPPPGPDDEKKKRENNTNPSSAALRRQLSGRHLNFIAIGGTVGTGFFLGTGTALVRGGPAGCLLAFAMVGTALWAVMACLGELATYCPTAGAFSVYAGRWVDPGLGFAVGWLYWFSCE